MNVKSAILLGTAILCFLAMAGGITMIGTGYSLVHNARRNMFNNLITNGAIEASLTIDKGYTIMYAGIPVSSVFLILTIVFFTIFTKTL